jgi:rubrerythrin
VTTKEDRMDILEYAMQMEKDGEAYYRDLASRSKAEGLTKILNMLAEDEVKHYNAFKKLKDDAGANLEGTEILVNARNIFAEAKTEDSNAAFQDSEIELYRKAIEIEKKSEAFYKEKAGQMESTNASDILLMIAEDEKRHQFLLENVVEYLSRPQVWVENAEFNHLSDY